MTTIPAKKNADRVREEKPHSINKQSIDNKVDLLYEQVEYTDYDVDFDFELRGGGYNTMVKLSNPLLLLALRLRKIKTIIEVEALYDRVKNEITGVMEELKNHSYDSATQLSFRYCLCTFIDEMVMSTKWGEHSVWAQRSLLANFHNETWGGKKFYSILNRVMLEPDKYQDLLEFIYLCLALGYKGQYTVKNEGREHIQDLLTKLHALLRAQRGEIQTTTFVSNIHKQDYSFRRLVPFWKISIAIGLLLVAVYSIYLYFLTQETQDVIQHIDEILR